MELFFFAWEVHGDAGGDGGCPCRAVCAGGSGQSSSLLLPEWLRLGDGSIWKILLFICSASLKVDVEGDIGESDGNISGVRVVCMFKSIAQMQ